MANSSPDTLEVHHPTVFDTGAQHLGQAYAKALLGATEEAGNSEQALQQFDSLIEDVLDKVPQMEAVLGSPRIAHEAKERILNRAFQGKMVRQLLNFLKVLSRKGRLDIIRPIHRAYYDQFNQLHQRVEVVVRSAQPIEPRLLDQIAVRLKQSLQSDVILRTRVDPDLIGGLVIQLGDTVYDGSIHNRLRRMRRQVLEATSQQIRLGVDRFATAE